MGRNQSALGVRSVYVHNQAYDMDYNTGQQGYRGLGQWLSIYDLFEMSSKVPAPAGSPVPAVPGVQPVEFHIHSLDVSIDILNSSSANMHLDLYTIVARKDIPLSSFNGGTPLTQINDVATPTSAWQAGVGTQDLSNNGIAPASQIGAIPQDSVLFNNYYGVVSKKTIVLAPNGQHCHKMSFKPNFTLNQNLIDTQVKYLNGLKGLTYYTMAVARGSPCQVGGALEEEGITTSSYGQLRAVVCERYTYSFLQTTGKTLFTVNTLNKNGFANQVQLNTPASGPVIMV